MAVRNRIYRVGIELEGGWEGPPKGLRTEHIVHDGSVSITDPRRPDYSVLVNSGGLPPRALPRLLVGEIPSPVLEPTEWEEWMRHCYPQHVNETCGMHTHVSFMYRIHYMRLMTPEFTPFVIKGLTEWAEGEKLGKGHPIWNRLKRKDHHHCAHIYLGDNQVSVDRKDYNSRGKPYSRYTALNYCWTQQVVKGADRGTIECRLLPMMETVDQAVRAVGTVFNLTNLFLSKMRDKEPRKAAKVALMPIIESHYRARV